VAARAAAVVAGAVGDEIGYLLCREPIMKHSQSNSRRIDFPSVHRLLRIFAVIAWMALAQGCASHKQATYATPELAVQDMVSALEPLDKDRLHHVFGADSNELVSSGDSVADRIAASRFLERYNQKHELIINADGSRTLEIGDNDWPFPVPIVESEGAWSFDTAAGLEEILNRRIGQNELDTIQTCLAIVDAQREYAIRDPDGDGVHEYAQKFLSTAGMGLRDGLFWETTSEEEPSPLGLLVADAATEGYRRGSDNELVPFHGYYYRMLTSQGPHANGGAFDYLVGENMIGGFALVTWPAEHGNSGVMTFIVNYDGAIYQCDLEDSTDRKARSMTLFDPDPSAGWTLVN
jgi:hypothetical protein